MILATASEMRRTEKLSMENHNIPSLALMERAGQGAFNILKNFFPDLFKKRIHVLVGKGNNGGDGLVMARYIKEGGGTVRIQLLASPEDLSPDALSNYRRFIEMGGESVSSFDDRADLYIDAILGTGISQALHGHYAEIVRRLNRTGKFVCSLDIPSGLSAETGRPVGEAVRAQLTPTFGLQKLGLFLYPGPTYAGRVEIVDIGLPEEVLKTMDFEHHKIAAEDLLPFFRARSLASHKGTHGHLLILAGSKNKIGASLLVARAALRTGAGLVTLALPETAYDKFPQELPELMIETLPAHPQGTFSSKSWNKLHALLKGKTALAVGPGIETSKGTVALVQKIVSNVPLPVILDADAINCLKGRTEVLRQRQGEIALTPHPGEMGRLLGKGSKEVQEDRLGITKTFARDHKIFVVLKGFQTVIANPEGKIFLNPTGNPGMGTAGMGDVLTGILGALAAQGLPMLELLQAGVYLHGLAGDLVASKLGDRGLIASDLIEALPLAQKKLVGLSSRD